MKQYKVTYLETMKLLSKSIEKFVTFSEIRSKFNEIYKFSKKYKKYSK